MSGSGFGSGWIKEALQIKNRLLYEAAPFGFRY